MIRVYLSGGMGGRVASEVLKERQQAKELCDKYGLLAVDPGKGEKELWKKYRIPDNFSPKIMTKFIARDKFLIRRCDVLLVLTGDNPSDGTWREMCYAEKIEIPVVLIGRNRAKDLIMSWSNIEVPYRFTRMEKAIKFIAKKWGKQNLASLEFLKAA